MFLSPLSAFSSPWFELLVVCALVVVFHFLVFNSNPILSLFAFLSFIILQGVVLLSMGYVYLAFVLISVYGGAIVVLFLLIAMLFNKKLID